MPLEVLPGQSFPIGATVYPGGVNFCVFSKNCEALELLLFDNVYDPTPAQVIRLDPHINRTFYYWHAFIPGIRAGQLYAYRAYGPFAPDKGLRFDGQKVLLDPYVRAVMVGANYSRQAASQPGDNCARAMKGVVVDPTAYNWEGDTPLHHPFAGTVIYEMHVGGFTHHPNSGVTQVRRGTYAGLIEKIPYLHDLGITAVELLPVQQFDDQDAPHPHRNYWGYSPIAFFAPHSGYASRRDPLGPVDEFRDMVKALHRAGIEVILDVVFNHTAEGGQNGPTLSFRGLENRAYYILEADQSRYVNFSGCGNTLNANQSIVRRLIIDCLHYWVTAMHVDGFRFDLASVLARDESGQPLKNPPILWEIESDPILAGTKIIAEAWDTGLYQVGSFIGHRWAEWNGQFRDDVRRFVKSDSDMVARLALRIAGSPDLYPQPDREPNRSINFITCHDGFTLNDLVSYNAKHNEANGENNRDGTDANFSWNCGAEGPTDDPQIEALRLRQIKNFLTILLTSQGTPMLLMGDEVRRTQQGNNNAYCQDNPLSWFDWDAVEHNAGLLRFVQRLIHFVKSRAIFQEERFWTTPKKHLEARIIWHGVRLNRLDWRPDAHGLSYTLHHSDSGDTIHVMLNAYWEPLAFELPALPVGQSWHRLVDTALPSPDDFCDLDSACMTHENPFTVGARSAVILVAG
ncbi:MAG: glycogen debranching protein GlgX [Anaerolineae bacterium]|nr:glycogen debranching protein GlgX [Anaerolineae bacterium]